MKKKLPEINIEGTTFTIDVIKEELVEKADPENIMKIKDMFYSPRGYSFHYDTSTKNLATFEAVSDFTSNYQLKDISIPNLTELDPLRMAERYNLTIENIKGKTDFELNIKPGSLIDKRWNKKQLPILKIAGHPFFVDLALNKLRPKDDFKSKGIDFDQISEYYDRSVQAYIIPYNPRTHEFQEIDHLTISELPKDIIVVRFAHQHELDRMGWNVKYGFGPFHGITDQEIQLHFNARTLPWCQTNIPHSIRLNLEEKNIRESNSSASIKPPGLPSNDTGSRKL